MCDNWADTKIESWSYRWPSSWSTRATLGTTPIILWSHCFAFRPYIAGNAWVYTQHYGYSWPGAKTPSHQYPQCWQNYHCTGTYKGLKFVTAKQNPQISLVNGCSGLYLPCSSRGSPLGCPCEWVHDLRHNTGKWGFSWWLTHCGLGYFSEYFSSQLQWLMAEIPAVKLP